jgi:Ca2+-binding EF-hand superfamily protein
MSDSDFIQQATDCFNKYDANGDNFIDPSELKTLLSDVSAEVGIPSPTDEDVDKILRESDDNGDRQISREEFVKIFEIVVQMKQKN